jgi:hypothetical protein
VKIFYGVNQWLRGRWLLKKPEFENFMRLSLLRDNNLKLEWAESGMVG